MKAIRNIFLPVFALMAFSLILGSCGEGNDSDVRKEARESLGTQNNTPPPSTPQSVPPPSSIQLQTPSADAAAASGVSHYICPNNCEGSGGPAQVNCPVCGTQYVHNQAYHNQPLQQTNTTTTTTTPQSQQLPPPTPEPAQNAAGVWHYTCPSGCEGGAGSATACASCGTTLTHNAAYHQ